MMHDRLSTRLTAGGWRYLVTAILMIVAAGCTAPPKPEGPTVTRIGVADEVEYERLWQTTEDVLLSYNFRLDRRDRQQGVITTYGETSPIFIEFWRKQPTPAYYAWESNLHAIRRRAEVYLEPAAEPGVFEARVNVDRYRYNLGERQVDNAAGAMRLYSSAAPTFSGRKLVPKESSRWIGLGRDGPMEQSILDEIRESYAASVADSPAATTQPATTSQPAAQ